ncbi:hypothetical protein J2W69_004171, partial [Rheinheimera soli]|nr:hypothetical protein [Rheinheimera soli]
MPVAFEIRGEFSEDILQAVLQEIVNRHEILRTVYRDTEIGAIQYIRDDVSLTIQRHDLCHFAGEMQQQALRTLMEADIQTPFDLSQDVMIRVAFVHLSRDVAAPQGVLMFNMHHIASDGWSLEVLVREFFILYQAFSEDKASPLAALNIQYADYAHWQRNWLQGEVLEKLLSYWENQLADAPPVHGLPLDYPRPAIRQHQGAVVSGQLSSDIAIGLQRLAQRTQLTPFMLLHSALSLVLSRHSNSEDILIGTPVANRQQTELDSLIGFFVNTLVLRVNTGQERLEDYLAHVRQVHLDAQAGQDVPFEQLVERLNVPRNSALTPLFQIMLTTHTGFGQAEGVSLTLPGVTLTPVKAPVLVSKFDLNVDISLNDEGVSLNWLYDTALFSEAHIAQLNDHVSRVLTAMSQYDAKSLPAIVDIPMLSEQEEGYLLEILNATAMEHPTDVCIHSLFEQQVEATPDATALVFEETSLTYCELNTRANQLARYLRAEYQVGPDSLVGLCVERSVDMVVGLLGILKAGGAYVPLDPEYPASRLEYMREDAGLQVILSQRVVADKIAMGDSAVVLLDDGVFDEYGTTNLSIEETGVTA